MKTIKLTNPAAIKAAQMIKQARELANESRKLDEAGKATLATIVKDERDIDFDALSIGEIINIDKICLVEIGKQTRLDQAAMQLQDPVLFAKYQKEFATIKFKPLV